MYVIADLKAGTTITLDGIPFVISWSQHSKQARGSGVMVTKLRNLLTGNTIQKTFQGNDRIEPAEVGFQKCQFLYEDEEGFHFMNNETFDQFSLSKEVISDDGVFLIEGEDTDVRIYNDQPIGIQLKPNVVLTVTDTPPGVNGDTASGGTKPATLENGITVQVPFFINVGDALKVDTREKTYIERASRS